MRRHTSASVLVGLAVAASIGTACAAQSHHPLGDQARRYTTTINGAGSSFDAPLFNAAFPHYGHSVTVNYAAVGSGTGQADLENKTVDFGAFDVPMGIPGDSFPNLPKITQIPVTLGAVAVTYNLPQYTAGSLHFTGATLAGIFDGTIKKWTDKALEKLNPGLKNLKGQKDETIVPIHRCDSSGTTYIFTDYLSNASSAFKKSVGTSKLPSNWPAGTQCGSHSSGVDAIVNSAQGAIGYAELAYAVLNNRTPAYIQNKTGKFLQPSVRGAAQDAAAVKKISPSKFSIVNRKGAKAYPISGFSWVGVYTKGSDWQTPANCAPTVSALKWLDSKAGQKYGPPNYYAALPKQILSYADNQLKKVKC